MATIEQGPNTVKSFDEKIFDHLIQKWWQPIGILLLFFILINSFGIIPAGHRGVLLTFGAVSQRIFGEGLYWKIPIIQSVRKIDVRIEKDVVDASAASKDLQMVASQIAINYHLDPDHVRNIYQKVGMEYKSRIIDPAIQESTKAITARFTAEELITRREVVRDEIKVLLKEKLSVYGILVDEFNITDFDFSKTFNDAIEAKVTTEQQALAAKNKLRQVEFEAQQRIAEAQGKAKALQIEGQAISSNPSIVQMRAIEKWRGEVPQYWGGGALPFITIK